MTTTTAPFAPTTAARTEVNQLSLPAILTLHLVPGVLVTLGFVALAPIAEASGFPPIAALLAAIALILVPVELGVLKVASRREGRSVSGLLPYRDPMRGRDWAWLVPTLIVLAFVGFGLHAM